VPTSRLWRAERLGARLDPTTSPITAATAIVFMPCM
jgi:hypothetical protein